MNRSHSHAGYAHPAYVQSLAWYGAPRELPRAGGWLLERPIPGTPLSDAAGPYPLFACRDWGALAADLESLDGIVCVGLVADPYGSHDPDLLRACFPDVVTPFKDHFAADLSLDPERFISAHHRRNARKALEAVQVEEAKDPALHAAEWAELYGRLVERHAIAGPAAFPAGSLRLQLQAPGMRMLRALDGRETAGIALWIVGGDVAYYHLAAYTGAGYRLGASFALFRTAIDLFAREGLRWMALGGAPGLGQDSGGLARFKSGWATGVRPAYFCGRVLDREAFGTLTGERAANGFFPPYRGGECGCG